MDSVAWSLFLFPPEDTLRVLSVLHSGAHLFSGLLRHTERCSLYKEVYEGTILRQQNGFKQGSEVRLITSASYSRRPFMSLMRERIILQLQLTTPGKVSMTVCRNVSISSPEAATA